MKVLVVEGDKVGRQAIVNALMQIDRVAVQDAVPDLQSAIQALTRIPDLVVTGVQLPDGDGMQVIAAARSVARTPSIVVVGRDASREEWRRHLEAGADRFVETDRDLRELREVVGALAHREPIDPMRLLGKLAAGITHDFNNYLTVIGATLALHQRKPDDRLLGEARQAVEAASRLTARLSSYVRGEPTETVLVDLADVVRDTLAIARSTLPTTVEVEVDARLCSVRGIVPELEQLVLNLLLNAGEAMPRGGRLHIVVGGGTIEIGHSGGPARATLGLEIVRNVAERHRAKVRVGPGSVRVVFPLPS